VPQPVVSRINVVYLYVRDLERSVAFYRDVLGVPVELDAAHPWWAEAILPGDVRFALHEWHPEAGEISSGTVRFDFQVEDVERAAVQLSAAGAEVGDVTHASWGSMCTVTDPDGYRIQLFQPCD
jgi:catechol 2,3-dioxygenase-like lactoylglutathione lyase family enzyme